MLVKSIKNGFINSLKICLFLIKIIVPVYLFITVLKHSPVMGWLVSIFTPLMGVFHLPGEAAVPLITGLVLDEYSAIAAIRAVNLTGYAVTVVAVMTLISHSLFVEAAIVRKMGLSAAFFTLYRLTAALSVGLTLGIVGTVLNLW